MLLSKSSLGVAFLFQVGTTIAVAQETFRGLGDVPGGEPLGVTRPPASQERRSARRPRNIGG